MKSGTYFVYHGKEYMDSTKSVPKWYKILLSGNKDDLNDGFYCTESENFMKKFGFVCEKKVPKSEITEAYEIRTYALYRNIEFNIYGSKDNQIRIVRYCSSGRDDERAKKLQTWQFSVFDADKFHVSYDSYISVDDPELEIVEKRTELDISKL